MVTNTIAAPKHFPHPEQWQLYPVNVGLSPMIFSIIVPVIFA
jgi:hypothetical protein